MFSESEVQCSAAVELQATEKSSAESIVLFNRKEVNIDLWIIEIGNKKSKEISFKSSCIKVHSYLGELSTFG